MECTACYKGLKVKVVVVTLWGVFCSQECADDERDDSQRSNDRDYYGNPDDMSLGE